MTAGFMLLRTTFRCAATVRVDSFHNEGNSDKYRTLLKTERALVCSAAVRLLLEVAVLGKTSSKKKNKRHLCKKIPLHCPSFTLLPTHIIHYFPSLAVDGFVFLITGHL